MASNLDDSSSQLRAALEPQLAVAAQRYPQAVKLLTAYDEACDQAAQTIIEALQQLTGKPVLAADLFEYYEASNKGELAWQLSLPAPQQVEHMTKAEVAEIVRRLHEFLAPTKEWDDLTLEEQAKLLYTADYYHNLLKLHLPVRYRGRYFNRYKGPDGQYHTLSQEEIVAKLLA